MPSWSIRLLEKAAEELGSLDRSVAGRIVKRLEWLAKNIDSIRPERVREGLTGFYKLRIGD